MNIERFLFYLFNLWLWLPCDLNYWSKIEIEE